MMIVSLLCSLFLFRFAYAWRRPEAKELIEKRDTVRRGWIEYVACGPSQDVDKLQGHIIDAERLAAEAYKVAEQGNVYYDAFFGRAPNSRYNPSDATIKERFRTLSHIQSTRSNRNPTGYHIIRCDWQNQPDGRCGGFGAPMITEVDTGVIWACKSFFNSPKRLADIIPPIWQRGFQPLDGFSPHGGLLLHEFTHSIWQTVDKGNNNGNPMYGHEETLTGVLEKGYVRARINADSYRMFATAAYWSNTKGTRWAIDPKKVRWQDL